MLDTHMSALFTGSICMSLEGDNMDLMNRDYWLHVKNMIFLLESGKL